MKCILLVLLFVHCFSRFSAFFLTEFFLTFVFHSVNILQSSHTHINFSTLIVTYDSDGLIIGSGSDWHHVAMALPIADPIAIHSESCTDPITSQSSARDHSSYCDLQILFPKHITPHLPTSLAAWGEPLSELEHLLLVLIRVHGMISNGVMLL
jgi:hypothetical protein